MIQYHICITKQCSIGIAYNRSYAWLPTVLTEACKTVPQGVQASRCGLDSRWDTKCQAWHESTIITEYSAISDKLFWKWWHIGWPLECNLKYKRNEHEKDKRLRQIPINKRTLFVWATLLTWPIKTPRRALQLYSWTQAYTTCCSWSALMIQATRQQRFLSLPLCQQLLEAPPWELQTKMSTRKFWTWGSQQWKVGLHTMAIMM